MNVPKGIRVHAVPEGVAASSDFVVQARIPGCDNWSSLPTYSVNASEQNFTRNQFNVHPLTVSSLDYDQGPLEVRAQYKAGAVHSASIRPISLEIPTTIEGDVISFKLDRHVDLMLEINDDKWQALHLLTNEIDHEAPTEDSENVWYFGPGLNNGSAYAKVDGGNLTVPSHTTLYLDSGAFLNARVYFNNVTNSSIRGHGFLYNSPNGGAILIERSTNILVEGVTSFNASGFTLTTGEAKNVHINRYRAFTSAGNGDGLDFFCSQDILAENCFLRNSDDTLAIYGHRWDYYGETRNITFRDSVVLPDFAHPVNIGTHGNPESPETLSGIHISNIDVLDHNEGQMWYQGCIAINAGDANRVEEVLVEDVRVEKITRGQLVNLRVMQNGMWTTAPGSCIRNVTFRNLELDMERSGIVNPSQILGYNATRNIQNVTFENLKVGGQFVHEGMAKPRWFMVSDFVPLFANEHALNVTFKLTEGVNGTKH
ncbi:pectin lyase-like protein [Corynespora cassiicola Philippines]|uniref:Pectin lyase-like protein n=1 Tax=Corynespora cassiicola Philippines TaxID=1448308 RepID=A0A2T2N6W3_CORCC|nr:pectin lyase-like protein [Corynespora cassiicola Philippines]